MLPLSVLLVEVLIPLSVLLVEEAVMVSLLFSLEAVMPLSVLLPEETLHHFACAVDYKEPLFSAECLVPVVTDLKARPVKCRQEGSIKEVLLGTLNDIKRVSHTLFIHQISNSSDVLER